jgi:arylsulfatase A-like enzyme
MKTTLPFILILLGLTVVSCQQSQNQQKPNVIFIMADDLGYADLGCYGQKLIKTPNIDKLAKEGMRFTQAYSGSSVCAPARSVLMTGMHTGHTRIRGNHGLGGVMGIGGTDGRVPIKDEDFTLAELMKSAGYTTGMVGKWGLGEPNTTGEPNAQGFDEFYGFLNQRRAHSYYPDYIWKNKEKVELTGNKNGKGTDYTHDLFADYSVDFIKRHKKEPFFLYLPLCIPHSRYELPDQGIYKDKDWPEDAIAYAAMISRMDKSIGQIMEALKENGLDENTIIFFTSDNGAAESSQTWKMFESNAPLRGVKRDPYEGGIRVPMIVRYPSKIAQGETSDLPWYFADVLPTLAELTGVSTPNDIDGTSVLTTLKGGNQDFSNRTMYWEFYEKDGWRATRFGDWKAIQRDMHKKEHQPIEIYNLKNDVGETTNLAEQHPELVEKAEHIFKESHIPSSHYVWKHLKK